MGRLLQASDFSVPDFVVHFNLPESVFPAEHLYRMVDMNGADDINVDHFLDIEFYVVISHEGAPVNAVEIGNHRGAAAVVITAV